MNKNRRNPEFWSERNQTGGREPTAHLSDDQRDESEIEARSSHLTLSPSAWNRSGFEPSFMNFISPPPTATGREGTRKGRRKNQEEEITPNACPTDGL